MFKAETIKKIRKQLQDAHDYFTELLKKGVFLKVSITKGNKKIGKTHNVSLAPMLTCGDACRVCCGVCYDGKACLQYTNVRNARAKNTAIMEHDLNDYFNQIDNYISRIRKNKYFRFHVGGDIPNDAYFEKMIGLARKYPDWIFWTYTKQYHIVNKYCRNHGNTKNCIPSNLSIMFSAWDGLPMHNPFGFAEFIFIKKENATPENISGKNLCNGNCQYCIENKCNCVVNKTTHVIEH